MEIEIKDGHAIVPLDYYHKLLEQEDFLHALEAAGVDCWEGYEEAQRILEGWYDSPEY